MVSIASAEDSESVLICDKIEYVPVHSAAAPAKAGASPSGKTLMLVNFKAELKSCEFGVPGWDKAYKDEFSRWGGRTGGVVMGSKDKQQPNYQGVGGTARVFRPGDLIVVLWFNGSKTPYKIEPFISFDTEGPCVEDPASRKGTWYSMGEKKILTRRKCISTFQFSTDNAGWVGTATNSTF